MQWAAPSAPSTYMIRGAVVLPSLILDRPPGQAPPVSIILSTCITCAEPGFSSLNKFDNIILSFVVSYSRLQHS